MTSAHPAPAVQADKNAAKENTMHRLVEKFAILLICITAFAMQDDFAVPVIALLISAAASAAVQIFSGKPAAPASFEDMLSKFKASSDEKMGDIKRNMDSKRRNTSRKR